jgi:hypothetical protein
VFKETVTGLLADLGADGVFGLLGLLEELGDLFEGGIGVLLFSFGVLDVLEEKSVCFVVDLLSSALGIGVDVFFQGSEPVDLLS